MDDSRRVSACARKTTGAVDGGSSRLQGRRTRRRGQAVVEFALVLPVMLLLLLVAIDFGRLFATYIDVANASREAAMFGAANPTDTTGIAAHAGQEANSQRQGGEGSLAVAVDCADSLRRPLGCASAAGGGGTGNTVTVTASKRFTFLTPLIGDLFGGGLTLSSSSTSAVLVMSAGGGGTPGGCGTLPSASFTFTLTGRTISLDASNSAPTTGACAISGYNWDMGDGADPFPPIVGRTATYTYSLDRAYTITLQVTNPASNATTTQTVTLGPPPSASPTPTPSPTPPPTATPSNPPPVCNTAPTFSASFTGNGNGQKAHQMTFYGAYTGQPAPSTWAWTFGDGGTDTGQTTTNNYDRAGTFTVTLQVRNGSCVVSTSRSVTVP